MDCNTYYFYVLYCQDQTLYAGYSTDVWQRVKCHNEGKGAKYTRVQHRRPVQLIYYEQWSTKSQAMSREARFKRLTRGQKDYFLKKMGISDYQNVTQPTSVCCLDTIPSDVISFI